VNTITIIAQPYYTLIIIALIELFLFVFKVQAIASLNYSMNVPSSYSNYAVLTSEISEIGFAFQSKYSTIGADHEIILV